MIWYAHLFQNFPQFIVIHTVKGFGIVNKAEIDAFLELSCFLHDPADSSPLLSLKNCKIKQWDVTKNLWEWLKIMTEPVAGEDVKKEELMFIAGGNARKV